MPCITLQQADARVKKLTEEGFFNYLNKVMEAKDLIKEALSHSNNPKIAFSGGKDSLVVMDLVRKIDPSVGGVFCNTRIEYLETPKYVRTFENIVELKPDRSYNFFKDCKANGIPTPKGKGKGPHSNRCCYKLKEQPAQRYYKQNDVDLVFTGLTSAESRNRMMFFKRMGPYYFYKQDKYWKCHPIHNWTDADVWEYIKRNKLSYNPMYDIPGLRRCGCRYCTAYLSWKEVTSAYNPKDTELMLSFEKQSSLSSFDIKTVIEDVKIAEAI